MEKRMQKRSLVKILLLAAIALFTGLAVLFAGLNTTKKVSGAEERTPAVTFVLGGTGRDTAIQRFYSDIEMGWNEAIKEAKSIYNKGAYVTAKLSSDWIADAEKGFALSGNEAYQGNYNEGRLRIPEGVDIEIDLFGHKLDRHLSVGKANGQVIIVEGGHLTISDSTLNKTGAVTGGFNVGGSAAAYGGGVLVESGALTLNSGSIKDNKISSDTGIFGIGVAVKGGTFTMAGGTISGGIATGTTNIYGGGVCVSDNGSFQMSGGTIKENTAAYGGGVAIYSAKAEPAKEGVAYSATIAGGVIERNKSTANGGGVYVTGSNVLVSGGDVRYNTSANGGGVYATGTDTTPSLLTVTGGNIRYNVAVSTENVAYGGGVMLLNAATMQLSNGNVQYNATVSKATDAATKSAGGGIYMSGAKAKLTIADTKLATSNPTIRYNKACAFTSANPVDVDVNEVCTALMEGDTSPKLCYGKEVYGGGVCVTDSATLEMVGGQIRSNSATYGGGVYADATVNLGAVEAREDGTYYFGGSIYANSATYGGGLYPATNASITLKGIPTINNNVTLGEEPTASNLLIRSKTVLNVGKLTVGANIHVTISDELINQEGDSYLNSDVVFTSGYDENNHQFISFNGDAEPDHESDPTNGMFAQANPNKFFVVDAIYVQEKVEEPKKPETTPTTPTDPVPEEEEEEEKAEEDEDEEEEEEEEKTPALVPFTLQLIVVNGEIKLAQEAVTFVVTDEIGGEKTYTLGSGRGDPEYNYVAYTYGDKDFPAKLGIFVPEETDKDDKEEGKTAQAAADALETAIDKKAGVYKLQSSEGVTFAVIVKIKQLSKDDLTITLDKSSFKYDGQAHEAVPTIKVQQWVKVDLNKDKEDSKPEYVYQRKLVTLEKGESKDYTLAYANNKNAGTATITITFRGNYAGTATATYEIAPDTESGKTMSVTWEYSADENIWTPFTTVPEFTFIPNANKDDVDPDGNMYSGVNQAGHLRVILTESGTGIRQAVYAEGITPKTQDPEWNTSMYLTFNVTKGSGTSTRLEVTPFRNIGTYTVKVVGKTNYGELSATSSTLAGVKMNPKRITLSASNFNNDTANEERPLWKLVTGYETDPETGALKPITDVLVGEVEFSNEGITQKFGSNTNPSNAWYIGSPLSLMLDGEYVISGNSGFVTVSDVIANAAEVITQHKFNNKYYTTGVAGNNGAMNKVETTIVIRFDDNIELIGSDGTVSSVTLDGRTAPIRNAMKLTKTWYILTRVNNIYMEDGTKITEDKLPQGWVFSNHDNRLTGNAVRPEHGSTVIYTYMLLNEKTDEEGEVVQRFALKYSDDTSKAAKMFYEVTYNGTGADLNYPIHDDDYLTTVNSELRAGIYKVVVRVAEEAQEAEHKHWWLNDESATGDAGAVYYNASFSYKFEVKQLDLTGLSVGTGDNSTVKYTLPDERRVAYNGEDVNLISFKSIMINGVELYEGVDYKLSAKSHTVGSTTLVVTGINSLKGSFEIKNAFYIEQADNSWDELPSIISWAYNGYDKAFNLISGKPKFLAKDQDMWFSISSDSAGAHVMSGLDHISLDPETKQVVYYDPLTGAKIEGRIANLLTNLPVGTYYLSGHVKGTDNYRSLEPQPIPFVVFAATNNWKETPSVDNWTQGKYVSPETHIHLTPAFGDAHVLIVDDNDVVYYDSDKGYDNLAAAKMGRYTLKAWVDGDTNYSKLDVYTVVFQVFRKPGLPWWGTLLVTVAALGAAALIIFILWKKGVFQILTEKIVVAIRTRASVEATIASVRAAKMMEEGRQSVADAKRRARIEQMRKKAQELRDMSPEERAAQLEAKAQEEAARAERLRARSEAIQAKAEKMRSLEAAKVESAPTDAETKTTTENAPANAENKATTENAPTDAAKKAKSENASANANKKAKSEGAPANKAKTMAGGAKQSKTPSEK